MSILPPPHPAAWTEALRPALDEAVAAAVAAESPFPNDIAAHIVGGHFEGPPHNEIIGPVSPRGAPNGLVLKRGKVVARWGDTRQQDMTFSVAKSYLSLLAGLAVGDGLIRDLDAPVSDSVDDPAFASERNRLVTWRMLLSQTSEWEGTLFGKADAIDRGRDLAAEGRDKAMARPLKAPGTYWEYNDVRVNALSLGLLHLFRKPLPQVFAERIMNPIGASRDWRWEGYRTSWIEIDGQKMQSVSGGGHWGGGLVIHAEDQARIGLLMAGDGAWDGRRLLPAGWVRASLTPVELNASYGLLWWLNGAGRYPSLPRSSYFALGAGGNVTWVEPELDVVAVFRWLAPAQMDAVLAKFLPGLA
ncbi:serine hydrolase [Acetobacteraceae bacterium H6797]|nr:serine hydrolase [Acetobacteraceae bacterium H6797]